MDKKKPIYIGNYSTLRLKKGLEKVYLKHTGEIFSKSIYIPSDRKGIFQSKYIHMKKYLDKKRRRYSVDKIYHIELEIEILRMWRNNQQTISVNKLIDIIRWRNIIAKDKQDIKDRFNKYVLRTRHKKMDNNLKLALKKFSYPK